MPLGGHSGTLAQASGLMSDDLVTARQETTLVAPARIDKKQRNHRRKDEKTTLEDKNQTREAADEQDPQPEPPLAAAQKEVAKPERDKRDWQPDCRDKPEPSCQRRKHRNPEKKRWNHRRQPPRHVTHRTPPFGVIPEHWPRREFGYRGPPRPNRRPPPSSLRSSAIWASPR